jgi:hypothetical protein
MSQPNPRKRKSQTARMSAGGRNAQIPVLPATIARLMAIPTSHPRMVTHSALAIERLTGELMSFV